MKECIERLCETWERTVGRCERWAKGYVTGVFQWCTTIYEKVYENVCYDV